ncbi:hypothetical protein QR680_005680 [Steinernema hermaphroditum]|uniref:Uncharacterized protein n=1 Tax=Steinernema hermaphroditum TaxID=289476 RepID=A0AA39HT06_9BILA|nr:hypothetical protein QR680_005680 [Steinernema hermaphroditum]
MFLLSNRHPLTERTRVPTVIENPIHPKIALLSEPPESALKKGRVFAGCCFTKGRFRPYFVFLLALDGIGAVEEDDDPATQTVAPPDASCVELAISPCWLASGRLLARQKVADALQELDLEFAFAVDGRPQKIRPALDFDGRRTSGDEELGWFVMASSRERTPLELFGCSQRGKSGHTERVKLKRLSFGV